jgi:hypothetical protein
LWYFENDDDEDDDYSLSFYLIDAVADDVEIELD